VWGFAPEKGRGEGLGPGLSHLNEIVSAHTAFTEPRLGAVLGTHRAAAHLEMGFRV
jgi:hypothetical protein